MNRIEHATYALYVIICGNDSLYLCGDAFFIGLLGLFPVWELMGMFGWMEMGALPAIHGIAWQLFHCRADSHDETPPYVYLFIFMIWSVALCLHFLNLQANDVSISHPRPLVCTAWSYELPANGTIESSNVFKWVPWNSWRL